MITLDYELMQGFRHLQEGSYYHRFEASAVCSNSVGIGRVDHWDTWWDKQACARVWQFPTEHSASTVRLASSSNELERGVMLRGSLAWCGHYHCRSLLPDTHNFV